MYQVLINHIQHCYWLYNELWTITLFRKTDSLKVNDQWLRTYDQPVSVSGVYSYDFMFLEMKTAFGE